MKKIFSFEYNLTDDYRAIGISAHLKDYKLCWNLNHILEINLQKNQNFISSKKKSTREEYSFYHYYDENNRCFFYLLSNKKDNAMLMSKMPEIDYILLIKGFLNDEKIEHTIANIKKTTNILTAFLINMNKYSEMNGFLTDMELHYINVIKHSNKQLLFN
ncbi:MAG: IPExxxVDY family protein [Bacteroidota bacterium]